MNRKGQALVEFVIILPIFLLLVFGVIDIGSILYTKITLQNSLSDVVDAYQENQTIEEIESELLDHNYVVQIQNDGKYVEISLEKELDLITPGLGLVLDDPYIVHVSRSILNE